MLQEYLVTVKNFEDLEQFYEDMETPGGSLYIPDREVDVALRRPISRNTHYMLTAEEAELVKQDSRVLDVISKAEIDLIEINPLYTQTSTGWNKSNTLSNTHRNWGLLRCVEGVQRSNWGSDGTTSQTGTIDVTSSGKNVDVVIVDGHLDPTHPEFAVNSDGTGGTRVIQYNWFQHNPQVTGGGAGTYVYTPYIDAGNADRTDDNNHGIHVAGTVAGNTHGWARDANIYNINPYSTNVNGTLGSTVLFDYIREFHRTKSVNSVTGYRNPTVVNNSWGSSFTIAKTSITNVFWRGTNYTNGFTVDANLDGWGLVNRTTNNVIISAWTSALIADVVDAINDGIIMIGAAGNESFKIDSSGGNDYDNTITWSGTTRNYHRGSWNTSGGTSICVGSVSILVNESKADYSNCGSRIDVYAPGTMIISGIHTETTTVGDPRNSTYRLTKYQGTSMASPQVCGVVACLLEQYPRMKQSDVKNYLNTHCTLNQMTDTGGGYTDNTSLQGSTNRYLFYKKERSTSGSVYPRLSYSTRATSGSVWPRLRSFRTPNTQTSVPLTISLISSSFSHNSSIALSYHYDQLGCTGSNTSPQLSWAASGNASEISTWRLRCVDLDSTPPNFIHWTVDGIPVSTTSIAENGSWPGGVTVNLTDWNPDPVRANGWGGPCPPPSTGTHRYQFTITAHNASGTLLATSNAYIGVVVT